MKPAYKILKYIFLFCLILLIVELSLTAASQLGRRSYLRTSKEIDIDSSAKRILCLGDSLTYGLGADNEYSYPVQLEKLLNLNNPERKFKVFYRGINGLSSSIIANNLSDYIKRYKPDILIILAGCNDHWAFHQSNLSKILKGDRINDRLLRTKIFLYKFRTFRLMQLVFNEIVGKIWDAGKKDELGTMKFSNITDENLHQELIEYNYKKIIQVVKSFSPKIKLFFQAYPTGPERINKFIKAVALNYKIPILEQDINFSKLGGIEPFVACDRWHLNARGYNLMAKNIYNEFLKEGIIAKRLIEDIEIPERKEINEIIRINENTWEYDLKKIADHPEKIISKQEYGWYLGANNMVDLPKIELLPGKYTLQIGAQGTPVEGVYPLVGFYYKIKGMDGKSTRNELNKIYVDDNWKDYFSKEVTLNSVQNVTFCISFENDAYVIKDGIVSDRNLYVSKIILNALSK